MYIKNYKLYIINPLYIIHILQWRNLTYSSKKPLRNLSTTVHCKRVFDMISGNCLLQCNINVSKDVCKVYLELAECKINSFNCPRLVFALRIICTARHNWNLKEYSKSSWDSFYRFFEVSDIVSVISIYFKDKNLTRKRS